MGFTVCLFAVSDGRLVLFCGKLKPEVCLCLVLKNVLTNLECL